MDIFEIQEESLNYKMTQREFFDKTKELLNKILKIHSQGWQRRALKKDEYPEESVCNECVGSGTFICNGEEKTCDHDWEAGDCYHTFCDYEQVGMELEEHIEDMWFLSLVDEIVD